MLICDTIKNVEGVALELFMSKNSVYRNVIKPFFEGLEKKVTSIFLKHAEIWEKCSKKVVNCIIGRLKETTIFIVDDGTKANSYISTFYFS